MIAYVVAHQDIVYHGNTSIHWERSYTRKFWQWQLAVILVWRLVI